MNPQSAIRNPQSLRRVADFAVLTSVLLLIVHTWHVAWFVVPTGSMADALIGVHRDVTCSDCGFTFACDAAEPTPFGQRAVCPNCGYAEQSLESFPIVGGDRLLVHKGAFALRPPRRWEMVAYRSPTQASQINVKRVVGLPGESIQIRDGDVYVNDQIARKSLAEQLAMAILVHDAAHESKETSGLPRRWRSERRWEWKKGDGTYIGREIVGSMAFRCPIWASNEALTYHHVHRVPGDSGRVEPIPVDDRYGYNQTRPVRDLFPTNDLLFTCHVRTTWGNALVLQATDGQVEFQARIVWDSGIEVFRNGVLIAKPESNLAGRDEHDVIVSLVDQQFALGIDGHEAFSLPYDRDPGNQRPPTHFAVYQQSSGVEVSNLRVWRDVYYTPPVGAAATAGVTTPYQLADDEYFVLGDNSPISKDSRYADAGPAVLANLLVGKPFMVYFPCHSAEFGGMRFQVPALSRIRYIP